MTGEEKLSFIAQQFARARKGQQDKVTCPYCSHTFKYGGFQENWKRPGVSPFCCDNMQEAATAIAHRIVLQSQIDMKKKIEERAADHNVSVLIH